ncbi:MAG: TIGR03085 family metal-binding protein, partial [Nocardioidaceae bacterium]
YPHSPEGGSVSEIERARLSDLFDQLGPSAPTLCSGWDNHHLVAHLVLRESSPVGLIKMLRPGAADAEIERLVSGEAFETLVDRWRHGPPLLSVFTIQQADRLGNSLEFFVHHEDVRRAQPQWTRRELPAWVEDELWSRMRLASKLLMRKSTVGAELDRRDSGDSVVAAKGSPRVAVEGLASELALFAFGRGEVADVKFAGSADRVEKLRNTRFGV